MSTQPPQPGIGSNLHPPKASSHVSCVQGSLSSQLSHSPPTHMPWIQMSIWVQDWPSSQMRPLGFSAGKHWPVPGSQTPAVHWSKSGQPSATQPPICTHAPP